MPNWRATRDKLEMGQSFVFIGRVPPDVRRAFECLDRVDAEELRALEEGLGDEDEEDGRVTA